jgi:hypothetical protein
MSLERNKELAIASFRLSETGDNVLADQIIAADFINREAEDDPGQTDPEPHGPQGLSRHQLLAKNRLRGSSIRGYRSDCRR